MPAKRMFILDLGSLSGDRGWFLPGAAGGAATKDNRNPAKRELIEVPVTAALIEHKDGIVLFDAGASSDANETRPTATQNFPLTRFSKENQLEAQLRSIGYKAGDVSYIVISHLHWDHIGQLPIFFEGKRSPPLVVQKKELSWALFSIWQGKGGYYTLGDLNPLVGANWFPLEEKTFELLDGVTLEWTGGHTPGHQILKVSLESGSKYILTGDYLHIPEEYELESKGWLLGNAEEWQTEIRKMKLEVLARKAKMIISHDPSLFDKFPKAPKWLD